jgi:hypothetical protein
VACPKFEDTSPEGKTSLSSDHDVSREPDVERAFAESERGAAEEEKRRREEEVAFIAKLRDSPHLERGRKVVRVALWTSAAAFVHRSWAR